MTCELIRMPNGVVAFVCGRGPRRKCSVCKRRPATLLCDFPLRGAKAGATCDRALCPSCAVAVGADRDYCPAHARVRPAASQLELPAPSPKGGAR